MTQYLIQDGSNVVFVATPALLARGDMQPYRMPLKGEDPTATTIDAKAKSDDTNVDNAPDIDPGPGQNKAVILPGDMKPVMDAKAEMEAIEDPDEMIAFIFQKYGLKLPKTMKKSTMIERSLATMQENKG